MPRMDQFADARYAPGVSARTFEHTKSACAEVAFFSVARKSQRTTKARLAADRRAKALVSANRSAPSRHRRELALGAFVSMSAMLSPAFAGGLTVEAAWVAPNENVGADVGLYMTIKNDSDDPDALLRAACPFANFSEKRTVDVGEGGLADRAIPNIPVAAHTTLTMTAKTYHVGLLQTRDKLAAGQSFTCNLSFRKAGAMEVKVSVSPAAP